MPSTVGGVTSERLEVRRQIAAAADATGVDFRYLVGQAQIESSLNPRARAATSSASGLFQFVEQTWLATLDRHGAEHGLGWAADQIRRGPDGRYHVADDAARRRILALRDDPGVSSMMAGEFASDNRGILEAATGRSATATDLYLAHFLGPAGAAQFLRAAAGDPQVPAATLFPQAAAANRAVFYDNGRTLSLGEVYGNLEDRMTRGMVQAGHGGGEGLAPPDARTEWQLAARAARHRAQPDDARFGGHRSSELAQLLQAAIAS